MDFLLVPTINFRLLSVLVILRHERRRLISLSVTDHPTAEWIAQQITEAFPWDQAPVHLIRDRDARYGQLVRWRMAMSIRDHPIAPRSPWQNGHAERLIGSIRRGGLDHVVLRAWLTLPSCLASFERVQENSHNWSNELKFQRGAAAYPEREQGTDSGQKCDHAHDGMGTAQETLHLFRLLSRHSVGRPWLPRNLAAC